MFVTGIPARSVAFKVDHLRPTMSPVKSVGAGPVMSLEGCEMSTRQTRILNHHRTGAGTSVHVYMQALCGKSELQTLKYYTSDFAH